MAPDGSLDGSLDVVLDRVREAVELVEPLLDEVATLGYQAPTDSDEYRDVGDRLATAWAQLRTAQTQLEGMTS